MVENENLVNTELPVKQLNRDLISLSFVRKGLVGPSCVPYGFLLCSPEEVVSCWMPCMAKDFGLGAVDQEEADESLDMIVSHLCDDERSSESDIEVVCELLSGFSNLRVHSSESYMLDNAGKDGLLGDQIQRFLGHYGMALQENEQAYQDLFKWLLTNPMKTEVTNKEKMLAGV